MWFRSVTRGLGFMRFRLVRCTYVYVSYGLDECAAHWCIIPHAICLHDIALGFRD